MARLNICLNILFLFCSYFGVETAGVSHAFAGFRLAANPQAQGELELLLARSNGTKGYSLRWHPVRWHQDAPGHCYGGRAAALSAVLGVSLAAALFRAHLLRPHSSDLLTDLLGVVLDHGGALPGHSGDEVIPTTGL